MTLKSCAFCFLFPLPVNSHCFFGDFFQVSESHRHGKLTAGGSPVGARNSGVNIRATLNSFPFVVCSGLKF